MARAAVAPDRGSAPRRSSEPAPHLRTFAAFSFAVILLGFGFSAGVASAAGHASPAGPESSAVEAATPPATAANPEIEQSELARLAGKSLLLDAVVLGGEIVAVGERGHVLVIAEGKWTQMPAPTRNSLTAITAVGDELWAVGHDAIILHSRDRGRTWAKRFSAPELDQPLFDVWFENASHGIAVGAYGMILETIDGGATWRQGQVPPPVRFVAPVAMTAGKAKEASQAQEAGADDGGTERPSTEVSGTTEPHLYAIESAPDGGLYLAGENGAFYRSDDRGKTWRFLSAPYVGTFFNMLPLSDGAILVFGLRGQVYRAENRGETWSIVATGSTASLTSGVERKNGQIVLVGLSGLIALSADGGRSFTAQTHPDRLAFSDIVEAPSGEIMLFGERGFELLAVKVAKNLANP